MFYCPTNRDFPQLFPNVGSKIITEPGSLEDSPCLEKETSYLTDGYRMTVSGKIAMIIDNYLWALFRCPGSSDFRGQQSFIMFAAAEGEKQISQHQRNRHRQTFRIQEGVI